MVSQTNSNMKIERITEIYVAVFPIRFSDTEKAETILAGYQKDPEMPNMSRVRATVETHPEAVLDLVELCDEIVNEQSDIESYRLLKFDKDGIHILSPEDFRTLDPQYAHLQWGCC